MSEMTLLPEISSAHRRDEADELSMDELEVVVGGAPVQSWHDIKDFSFERSPTLSLPQGESGFQAHISHPVWKS